MILATILLLCPFPQIGEAVKEALERPAAVSVETAAVVSVETKDSSLSEPSLSVPEPKVKTDLEAAAEAAAASPAPLSAAADPIGPHVGALPLEPAKRAMVGGYEGQRERKMWYALAAVGHSAAVFDAWSTRRAISRGYGSEANPLLRPFAHSGMMYAATQVSPAVMDFVGRRMMVSQHGWVRHMWWLPQAAGAGFSIGAGVHNVGVVP